VDVIIASEIHLLVTVYGRLVNGRLIKDGWFHKQATLYNVYSAFMTSLFACFLEYIRYNLIVSFLN